MNRKQITDKIEEVKRQLDSEDPNAHNMAQNILSVLEIMLDRWDEGLLSDHGFYDEETDFDKAYDNVVEELIEAEC